MPRSRRRHHSRSRSRSRSQSHDRDPKRRRIENAESPQHPKSSEDVEKLVTAQEVPIDAPKDVTPHETSNETKIKTVDSETKMETNVESSDSDSVECLSASESGNDAKASAPKKSEDVCETPIRDKKAAKVVTPKRATLTPKQLQKKLDSEKKKQVKQQAKDERERKRQEERDEKEKKRIEEEKQKLKEKEEKQKQKEEKDEQKRLEREAKLKEKEDKKKEKEEKEEQKRKEKEEKEEQKRKEKEEKEEMRKKEIEEKERKKQQELEQSKKAAMVFSKFFVPKKSDAPASEETAAVSAFMPFNVKPDMRLAPTIRRQLTNEEKEALTKYVASHSDETYLNDLKTGKAAKRKTLATWTIDEEDDDIMILEENDQSIIIAQDRKVQKQRAKMLKFHENRRPAYFGTWRKKSKTIKPKKPFATDTTYFDYEVDSDDDWEEEGQGESLAGSDNEEEKENASENDYEEDNEFFVPHGYLSEGEGEDDEDKAPMSPESHKAKLKLLKSNFEEEINSKTERLKPRMIGCVWESKDVTLVQDAFHTFLQQRAMITNGTVEIKKRDLTSLTPSSRKSLSEKKQNLKQLEKELIPTFLQLVHGNVKNQMFIVNEFLDYMATKGLPIEISKSNLAHHLKKLSTWMKCPDEGPLHNKFCWYVSEEIRQQYNANLSIPNKWNYTKSA